MEVVFTTKKPPYIVQLFVGKESMLDIEGFTEEHEAIAEAERLQLEHPNQRYRVIRLDLGER